MDNSDISVHDKLKSLLDNGKARYRLVQHTAAGKSEEVALARGTEIGQGAKALVCLANTSERQCRQGQCAGGDAGGQAAGQDGTGALLWRQESEAAGDRRDACAHQMRNRRDSAIYL